MESNIIRNYNILLNNGSNIPGPRYIKKIIPLVSEEDKNRCLLFLTRMDQHINLCHNLYSDRHINIIIEESDFFIYYHPKGDIENIITFALVKFKKHPKKNILDILLVCAIPNNERFGQMIANALYNFAVKKKRNFLYTSPRTPQLRETFIKYGFDSLCGIQGINEVLEKEISIEEFTIERNKKNKTRRQNKITVEAPENIPFT